MPLHTLSPCATRLGQSKLDSAVSLAKNESMPKCVIQGEPASDSDALPMHHPARNRHVGATDIHPQPSLLERQSAEFGLFKLSHRFHSLPGQQVLKYRNLMTKMLCLQSMFVLPIAYSTAFAASVFFANGSLRRWCGSRFYHFFSAILSI